MINRMWLFAQWARRRVNGLNQSNYQQMEDLIRLIAKYKTPDTLAKLYYFQNDDNVDFLKDFLCLYFYFEQLTFIPENFSDLNSSDLYDPSGIDFMMIKNDVITNLDYRYAQFFASTFDTINGANIENSNVRFVTWNYDLQIPILLATIKNEIPENIIRQIEFDPNSNNNNSTFPLLSRMNGRAILSEKQGVHLKMRIPKNINDFKELILEAFKSRRTFSSELKFAWDHKTASEIDQKSRESIKNLLSETKNLVVIGYSFPNYNRLADKEILANFRGDIVLQTTEFSTIKSRILSCIPHDQPSVVNPDRVQHESALDQFFVPDDILA